MFLPPDAGILNTWKKQLSCQYLGQKVYLIIYLQKSDPVFPVLPTAHVCVIYRCLRVQGIAVDPGNSKINIVCISQEYLISHL